MQWEQGVQREEPQSAREGFAELEGVPGCWRGHGGMNKPGSLGAAEWWAGGAQERRQQVMERDGTAGLRRRNVGVWLFCRQIPAIQVANKLCSECCQHGRRKGPLGRCKIGGGTWLYFFMSEIAVAQTGTLGGNETLQ